VSNPPLDYKHLLDVLDDLMRDLDALSRPRRTTVENKVRYVMSLLAQEPQSILQKNPYFSSHPEDFVYRDVALGKVQAFVHEPVRFFRDATLSTLEVASFEFLNELSELPVFCIEEWKHTEEWRESRLKLAHALFSFLHHRNVELARQRGTPQLKKGNDLRLRKAAAKRQMIRNCATYFERKGKERRDFAGLIFKLQGRTIELEGKNTKVELNLRRPSSVQRILKQLGI
jgi:hypothetical protein